MLQTQRRRAKLLKRAVVALWFAYRTPLSPWYARLIAVLVVAYAFSPIDLIPDFIPVIGLLDDAILLPVGIWLALKLVPAPVMAESRQQAQSWLDARKPKPQNYFAAALFIALWILAAWLLWRWLAE
ncbi:MAG: YkvA family protein [Burkholderiales bacterium]